MSLPMPPKRWQAKIEIGKVARKEGRTIEVYGETIKRLGEMVSYRLLSEKPIYFSNFGDHIAEKIVYFYSYGMRVDEFVPISPEVAGSLEKGWWCQEVRMLDSQVQEFPRLPPMSLESLEDAIDHFIEFALIPEKGPDYHSRAIEGSEFRLHLLEKVLREADEHPINDLIMRGWHVVALEYKGELSMSGELMNRKAIFVMGHPEAQAAMFTLTSERYKNR